MNIINQLCSEYIQLFISILSISFSSKLLYENFGAKSLFRFLFKNYHNDKVQLNIILNIKDYNHFHFLQNYQ